MTWLHIPGLPSTSSASAPEATGSISASSWQCQQLAQSVWWRGKPSRSQDWSRRCGKASFLRLLSGAMPGPSTAARGAASWMASLAASRASLTALPAGDAAPTIRATYGRSPDASSCSPVLGGVSSRTSPACSPRRRGSAPAPSASGETYKDWVSRLRADFSARRKSARATSASGCSSSAWPTATARDHRSLCASQETMDKNARPLSEFVGMWSTPRASDGEKGGPNRSFRNGTGDPLPTQSAKWATPRAEMVRALGNVKHITTRRGNGNIEDQASRFTPPSPETPTDGEPCSNERRSLNPLFVEWLMGWPPGWTSFACSATALCRWRQRMRSALSSLASPREAPPAQLSFAV